MKNLNIRIELNPDQAWAFAQFLKRVGYSDYRPLAQNEEEAYEMQYAGELVRKAFAQSGIAPR